MPELIATVGAIVAGASCGVAIIAIGGRTEGIDAASWLERRRHAEAPRTAESPGRWSKALDVTGLRERLANVVDRAGWKESPERIAAFSLALWGCTAVLGAASSSIVPVSNAPVLGSLGFVSGIGCCALVLRSAIASRRRRLVAELVTLLELFTLELSGGGSALSALGSVTTKVRGELASDLRRLLIASQVVGSAPFESRLMQYSDHLDIPAIASLATILAASREYGTGVGHGVRALATDLRHAQRRELIAHSRRALNQVLILAGVGVLLPFLAVVMFPAVTALERNLH
jgi:Flp pilus assembly protein TadB